MQTQRRGFDKRGCGSLKDLLTLDATMNEQKIAMFWLRPKYSYVFFCSFAVATTPDIKTSSVLARIKFLVVSKSSMREELKSSFGFWLLAKR